MEEGEEEGARERKHTCARKACAHAPRRVSIQAGPPACQALSGLTPLTGVHYPRYPRISCLCPGRRAVVGVSWPVFAPCGTRGVVCPRAVAR